MTKPTGKPRGRPPNKGKAGKLGDLAGVASNLTELLPAPSLSFATQHQAQCDICKGPADRRTRVDDALNRGVAIGTLGIMESLPRTVIQAHSIYLKSFPLPALNPQHADLRNLTDGLAPESQAPIPLESVHKLRNDVVPGLINTLISKVAEGDKFSLGEGVDVLDALVRLLKVLQYQGGVSTGSEIPDARQLAVGKLSDLYNNAQSEEEKQTILQVQKTLVEAMRAAERIMEGKFTVIS